MKDTPLTPIQKRVSRKLSLVLRHDPSNIGLELDKQGWALVNHLLKQLSAHRLKISREDLELIVATNDKQRFRFSENGLKIRANQGHSIPIDLALKPVEPPEYLFHGSATKFLDSILADGLKSKSRQHVHLSSDYQTATSVGKRHGNPVILKIAAAKMQADGFVFYQSDNGVWLTDKVPANYLKIDGYPA